MEIRGRQPETDCHANRERQGPEETPRLKKLHRTPDPSQNVRPAGWSLHYIAYAWTGYCFAAISERLRESTTCGLTLLVISVCVSPIGLAVSSRPSFASARTGANGTL